VPCLCNDSSILWRVEIVVAVLTIIQPINQFICFKQQSSVTVENKGQENDRISIGVTDRNTVVYRYWKVHQQVSIIHNQVIITGIPLNVKNTENCA